MTVRLTSIPLCFFLKKACSLGALHVSQLRFVLNVGNQLVQILGRKLLNPTYSDGFLVKVAPVGLKILQPSLQRAIANRCQAQLQL